VPVVSFLQEVDDELSTAAAAAVVLVTINVVPPPSPPRLVWDVVVIDAARSSTSNLDDEGAPPSAAVVALDVLLSAASIMWCFSLNHIPNKLLKLGNKTVVSCSYATLHNPPKSFDATLQVWFGFVVHKYIFEKWLGGGHFEECVRCVAILTSLNLNEATEESVFLIGLSPKFPRTI
jgi:hypothetical protein